MSTTGLGPHILVVDDERAIRRFLRASLTAHGYVVHEVGSGEEALTEVMSQRPDVIILDLWLPGIDGVEVTRRLREWTQTPIIVLSARDDEQTKVLALDAGADDYLTKPFGVGELLARMRAALRHVTPSPADGTFSSGGLTVDMAHRLVSVDGQAIQLTPTEYDLLRVLVTNAGQVMTHRQLLRQVWGPGYDNEAHLLRVNISNLRRKIEPEPARPQHIINEPGVGYRLRDVAAPESDS